MKHNSKTTVILMFATVALIAAGAGLWLSQNTAARSGTVADQSALRDGPFLKLPQAKPIADFALYDGAGEGFSRAGLEGDYTLVFFGFTSCPHICPSTLHQLTQVVDGLEGELPPDRVPNILFISVDPERDTPKALEQYSARFGPSIQAVSGPDAQLRALAMQLGVHYVVPEHDPDEWYNVDHSLSVLLLDPEVRWVGVFSAPHDGAAMREALQRFLEDA
jgi:protein SCO1/2